MENKHHSTSDILDNVVHRHTDDTITVGQIKESLHERGFGLLLALASLPLCIPVPVPPGYTTLFSIPLFILSTQMIFGMDSPWLPKWLTRRRIARMKLASMLERAVPLLRKIEKLMRPRLSFASSHTGEKVIGMFAFVFTISIALPFPLTNLPPGYGILIMSLGLLSRDGLTIIIGMIVGTIGLGITLLILILGQHAVMALFS
ncbi:MAG: exopolysaccharide biosynthesis protein [Hyphomicrobiales bacterium]|nr:exopolysaccharide biosynthesis protein [Hyphomicrobiales bacterium]